MTRLFFQLPVLFVCAQLIDSTLHFSVRADTFGAGTNTFEIEFVPIGNPANLADTEGFPFLSGAVEYHYGISKFEISEGMIDKANAQSILDGSPLNIPHDERGDDKPATNLSWFEAAQFVNWLNTSMGQEPAYKFVEVAGPRPMSPPAIVFALWEPGDEGFNPQNTFRNSGAMYVLPTIDEWYKAAYFDPLLNSYNPFPTGGLSDPVAVLSGTDPGTAVFSIGTNRPTEPASIMLAGGMSPYGTIGQGGNVEEWLETEIDQVNDDPMGRRGAAGGFWESSISPLSSTLFLTDPLPNGSQTVTGFRVVFVPEPCSLLLATGLFLSGINSRKLLRPVSR